MTCDLVQRPQKREEAALLLRKAQEAGGERASQRRAKRLEPGEVLAKLGGDGQPARVTLFIASGLWNLPPPPAPNCSVTYPSKFRCVLCLGEVQSSHPGCAHTEQKPACRGYRAATRRHKPGSRFGAALGRDLDRRLS